MVMTKDALLNQKGGVAKTTTTLHLGGTLAASGRRTLLVDLDGQGNLTDALLVPRLEPTEELTLARAMLETCDREQARSLVRRHSENLWLIPSSLDLFTLPRRLHSTRSKEERLAWVLELLADDFDHCLVDCRPALDVDTDNILRWAEHVLIPVDVDTFSLKALELLLGQIQTLIAETRMPMPHYRGLVINRINKPFSGFHQKVYEAFHRLALPVVGEIPLRTLVAEAKDQGQTLAQYAPASDVARMYRDLAVAAGYLPKDTSA
ncbi:ParA family protein [Streptomyces sp. 8L]|uniref:ParA family protein n=1 Tax=Streptomyces sp. 8L TaxID=2877242 RepID=UPI001CD717BD|nr:ParA family protein [Streptomyces sp. 8L]MCA1224066.1 ParA family protein [Streptomyces sp. 8L]